MQPVRKPILDVARDGTTGAALPLVRARRTNGRRRTCRSPRCAEQPTGGWTSKSANPPTGIEISISSTFVRRRLWQADHDRIDRSPAGLLQSSGARVISVVINPASDEHLDVSLVADIVAPSASAISLTFRVRLCRSCRIAARPSDWPAPAHSGAVLAPQLKLEHVSGASSRVSAGSPLLLSRSDQLMEQPVGDGILAGRPPGQVERMRSGRSRGPTW